MNQHHEYGPYGAYPGPIAVSARPGGRGIARLVRSKSIKLVQTAPVSLVAPATTITTSVAVPAQRPRGSTEERRAQVIPAAA